MKKFVRWAVLWAVLLVLPAQVLAVQFYISTDDILQNAVTGNIIAAGAVTNDKIQVGTITKDRLAFTVDSAKYANLVIVAKSGGDFTSPIDAINSVTTASAANPFVVKVMPGVYDLGTSSLQMKEYVYLEGSGEDSTVITAYSGRIRPPFRLESVHLSGRNPASIPIRFRPPFRSNPASVI